MRRQSHYHLQLISISLCRTWGGCSEPCSCISRPCVLPFLSHPIFTLDISASLSNITGGKGLWSTGRLCEKKRFIGWATSGQSFFLRLSLPRAVGLPHKGLLGHRDVRRCMNLSQHQRRIVKCRIYSHIRTPLQPGLLVLEHTGHLDRGQESGLLETRKTRQSGGTSGRRRWRQGQKRILQTQKRIH